MLTEAQEASSEPTYDPKDGAFWVNSYVFDEEPLMDFVRHGQKGDTAHITSVPAVHLGDGEVFLEWPEERVTLEELEDAKPSLEDRLYAETGVKDNADTSVLRVGENSLLIEPAMERSMWLGREVESLDESDEWTIVNVQSGPHGPGLVVERR